MDKLVLRSYDEESNFPYRVGNFIENALEEMKLDTINEEYIVTITVDKVIHTKET